MVLSMRGEFHDFDAFAESVKGWGLDWIQMVRRDLLRKSPDSSISDVAAGWGFWHRGQFAAVYRRRFGEQPSETVKRT